MRPLSNIALVVLALIALSIRFKPHEASRALLHDEEHKVSRKKNENLPFQSLDKGKPTRPPGPNPPTNSPGHPSRKSSKANTSSQKKVAAGNTMQPMKVVNEEKNRNLLSESLTQNTPTHSPRPNPPTHGPGHPPRKSSNVNTISQKKVAASNAMQTMKTVIEEENRNLSSESLEKNSINPPTNGPKMASWSKASTIYQNTFSGLGGPPLVA